MPIYEYKCLKCSNAFEAMQKFSDAPLVTCPKCEGPIKKQVSTTSFHLKGTGWYLTDYAKKDLSAASDSKESKETPPSETKSSSSTDTE
jgi:putative FmdB family regulatory protein